MDFVDTIAVDVRWLTPARRVSRIAGVGVATLGVVVLLGLAPFAPAVSRIFEGWTAIKANVAVAFVAAGVAIFLLNDGRRWSRLASRALAVVVLAIGVVTLLQYVPGRNLGVDQLLFREGPNRPNKIDPGRMGVSSAINLSVIGIVLLALNGRSRRWHSLAQWGVLIPAFLSMLSLIAIFYGAGSQFALQRLMIFSTHGAIGFLALCVGLMLARPERGPVALILSDSLGGIMCRALLPLLPVISAGLGRLRLAGSSANLFNERFGVALQVTTSTLITSLLIWWAARMLTRMDLRRQKLVESLKESGARSRQICEGLPQLVWTLRADGSCDYLSPQWLDYTGMQEAQALDWGWSEAIHPDDRERVLYSRDRFESGTQFDAEFRLRSASGEYRWFRTLALPLKDEAGKVVKWFGTNTDIESYRVQAAALRESEARLQRILSAARLGHWEWDLEADRIVYLNGNDSLFGQPSDMTFDCYSEFLENVHPEDHDRLQADIDHSIATDAPFDTEFRVVWPDGSLHWLSGKGGVSRDESGKAIRMAGINSEITERKEAEAHIRKLNEDLERRVAERTRDLAQANAMLRVSEERYRNVVEDQTELVSRFSPDGTCTFVNDVYCRFFGKPLYELLHRSWTPVVHPDDVDHITTQLASLSPQNPLVLITNRVFDLHGQERWMEFANRGLFDEQGQLVEIQSVGRDITERKRAEAEIRRALATADAATRAKGEFLANMSHEIRTPMNGVIGMTDLLLDTPLNGVQRDYMQTIRSSGHALLTVINDILDFSKIEAGKLTLERSPFRVRALVSDVSDLLAPPAHQKGLKLAQRVADEVPEWVVGDGGRIRQVLMNLAGNAVKFTDEGEVEVEAILVEDAAESLTLRFLVRDSGVGIPEDRQADVFESFTQVEGGNDRKHGGTGLGLTICRSLVTMMGGRIGLESQPGRGSSFWFELPLGKAGDETDLPRPEFAGLHVLVVDEDEAHRDLVTEMLRSWDCRPEIVHSPDEALARIFEAASGDPFQLVLLDHHTFGMGAEQVAEAIAALPGFVRTPIVLMVSPEMTWDGAGAADGPFLATLTKPLRRMAFYDVLSRVASPGLAPKAEGPVDTASPAAPASFCVLLADDNEVNRRVATAMIERLGGRVEAVLNGRQAVNALDHDRHDLVLMDVQMPEMDGFAATSAIREAERSTGRHIPIIAMTAHAMKGDRDRCLEAGMDDYLTKPVCQEPLQKAITAWTGHRKDAAPSPVATSSAEESFSREALLKACGGDPHLIRDVLGLTLKKTPDRVARLGAAVGAGDGPQIAWEAHGLKGALLVIGALALGEQCESLMVLGQRGRIVPAKELFREIARGWDRLAADLPRYLESLDSAPS